MGAPVRGSCSRRIAVASVACAVALWPAVAAVAASDTHRAPAGPAAAPTSTDFGLTVTATGEGVPPHACDVVTVTYVVANNSPDTSMTALSLVDPTPGLSALRPDPAGVWLGPNEEATFTATYVL